MRGNTGLDREITVKGVSLDLAHAPARTYLMGSPVSEKGRNSHKEGQHEVTLSRGFYISTTPVTQALYEAVTGHNPSIHRNCAESVGFRRTPPVRP